MDNQWKEELDNLIGDQERVLKETADLVSYGFDGSFGQYQPERVVQPNNKEEVVSVIKIANQYQIPVYPRGQATCLSGGPLPIKGGIVLDTCRMTEKLEVDRENLTVDVSPGIITSKIKEAAEEKGFFYPPDPSSAHVSTIGGNVAENSSGPRGLKYGVTGHYVLGLEMVTPEGEVIRTGGRTIKNVTGYNLTQLIVGSEGTLGVVTEITLKLVPKPKSRVSLLAVFDDLGDSGRAISGVLSAGILPSALEIMDRHCIEAVENYKPSGYPTDAAAILLVELDGHPKAVEDEIDRVDAICKQIGAREVQVAVEEDEQKKLWEARKLVSPAIAKIKPTKISEDATVPRSKIPDMFERLNEIREKYQIELVVFGHAGDGNLHPNILTDKRDHDELKRVEQAITEIFEAAIELGGTLSGEHGIGNMKSPFMEKELGAVGIDMMKRVKESWDPNNIMNPGKIFPEKGQTQVVLTD
ncbi:FAD-binding oxidoreductase [Alkalibacillus haloalkaliphilus]|uniref:FAD-binding oxidoreductase n=1 Tax=Alkalibacillus haloalkaliphilus TaxID=94136 RepID=UPI00293566D6|nr:FAD-linked oxidase C-terminal domain-containing protein [Alkalibacillus haloalkaliphilus]MDV2582181.1 FAD-linked oxidase C-terminal domain-containing protein [Alkalibacillus haloalkaliphilus]